MAALCVAELVKGQFFAVVPGGRDGRLLVLDHDGERFAVRGGKQWGLFRIGTMVLIWTPKLGK